MIFTIDKTVFIKKPLAPKGAKGQLLMYETAVTTAFFNFSVRTRQLVNYAVATYS